MGWIVNSIKDIEKEINDYTKKINKLNNTIEEYNKDINKIKNKGIKSIMYYFERKEIEKKCNITQLEIN